MINRNKIVSGRVEYFSKILQKIKSYFKSQNTGRSSITTFEVKNVEGLSLQIQLFSHGFTFFIEMTFLSENNSHWIMAQRFSLN